MGFMYISGFVLNIINDRSDISNMTPRTLEQVDGIASLATILISAFSVVILALTTVLCVFHIKLAVNNETTRENLKGLESEGATITCWTGETRFEPRMFI